MAEIGLAGGAVRGIRLAAPTQKAPIARLAVTVVRATSSRTRPKACPWPATQAHENDKTTDAKGLAGPKQIATFRSLVLCGTNDEWNGKPTPSVD